MDDGGRPAVSEIFKNAYLSYRDPETLKAFVKIIDECSAMTIASASAMQAGGNMEGKERFGIANSVLWATVTTDASCGAVNSMHDSHTPLGGMIPLINIMLGEIIFGGVDAGLYGILICVVLAVFIAGLMVGRRPEYLGKKIESFDVKAGL